MELVTCETVIELYAHCWIRSGPSGAHRPEAVEKYDFCYHRMTAGVQAACVQACPTKAMIFGDLNQPGSEVARLVSTGDAQPLRGDLKLDFFVFYIKKNPASPEDAP